MFLPVFCANVASVIGGNATAVDDDSENHETKTGGDLNDTDNEFDLAVSLDTEELDDNQQDEQRNNPGRVVDAFRS